MPFLSVFHHDGRVFRRPGLYAFARRSGPGGRLLLFVGHTDNIATAMTGHRLRGEALRLGFDELNVCTQAVERLDRLILTAHIVKRCQPILNLLEDQVAPSRETSSAALVEPAARLSA